MPRNKFWCISFCLLLQFCPGFGQDIALPPEAISPVTLSAEDYNRLVINLRQATLDALTWNTSINERTAEIDKKQNSTDKREADLNERELSLNRRDAILSESEADSDRNKAEVTTLRSDLRTASESLSVAEKKASSLEFELFVFKGVAVAGSIAGAAGLIYGIVHAN
jgi:hypothetical protein